MASRKDNLKALFSNTRSRVIILFTALLIVIAATIGITKLKIARNMGGATSLANLSTVPTGIQSIPGALNPTAQYAKLQQMQNVTQAETAIKTGSSAIPTIIKTQEFGSGATLIGPAQQQGVGFTALALESNEGPQHNLWLNTLKNGHCSKASVTMAVSQGAQLSDLHEVCSCAQLKDDGYTLTKLQTICPCKALKAAGFSARQLKDEGSTAQQLRLCGFDACELRAAGFTAQELKDAGFSDGELKGAGYSENEIANAKGLPDGISEADVCSASCQPEALQHLSSAGVNASAIRRISGCDVSLLKAAGYSAGDLKNAGFSAANLKNINFTPIQLRVAGFSATELLNTGLLDDDLIKAGFPSAEVSSAETQLPLGVKPADIKSFGCDANTLRRENISGVSVKLIVNYAGCSPQSLINAGLSPTRSNDCSIGFLQELKAANVSINRIVQSMGCNVQQIRAAGYSLENLKTAGFTAAELKRAGFSVSELKNMGLSAQDLYDICLSPTDLKNAGYTSSELKEVNFTPPGMSPTDIKQAGCSADALKKERLEGLSANLIIKYAGCSPEALAAAGFDMSAWGVAPGGSQVAGLSALTQSPAAPSNVVGPPSSAAQAAAAANTQQLQSLLKRQNEQLAEQRFQQKIQQQSGEMLGAANQFFQGWQKVSTQTYVGGNEPVTKTTEMAVGTNFAGNTSANGVTLEQNMSAVNQPALIKTGDVLFAVMDTSVDSDEPGPILATIVSGRLKGTKLIGSFTLATSGDSMIITFNTMSVPGASGSTSINAYAIDPNTARTALASNVDNHYLYRYGSLFASSFIQGFGNAFQSANTTVTIGGTGGGQNITVQNGIGRSALQNAVIGLATVGQNWSQFAQQNFNTPATVRVCSGTPVGVLFTQDVAAV